MSDKFLHADQAGDACPGTWQAWDRACHGYFGTSDWPGAANCFGARRAAEGGGVGA
jgi:hypothetical protein